MKLMIFLLHLFNLFLENVDIVIVQSFFPQLFFRMEIFIFEIDNQHLVLFDYFLQVENLLQQILAFKTHSSAFLMLFFSQVNFVGMMTNLIAFFSVAGVVMLDVSVFAGRFRVPHCSNFTWFHTIVAIDLAEFI